MAKIYRQAVKKMGAREMDLDEAGFRRPDGGFITRMKVVEWHMDRAEFYLQRDEFERVAREMAEAERVSKMSTWEFWVYCERKMAIYAARKQ